jgi:hypothetical protein
MGFSDIPIFIWKNNRKGYATIYYLERTRDENGFGAGYDTLAKEFIVLFDISIKSLKYHDKQFYITGTNGKGYRFFFSIPAEKSVIDVEAAIDTLAYIGACPDEFYIYDGSIYFTEYNNQNGLCRASLDMLDVEKIFDYAVGNTSIEPDDRCRLGLIRNPNSFLVYNNYIYYINSSDNFTVYRYDMVAKKNIKIYGYPSFHLDIWKESIFIINNDDYKTVVYSNGEIIDFKKSLKNSCAFFNGATIRRNGYYGAQITNSFATKEIILEDRSWEVIYDICSVGEDCYIYTIYERVWDSGDHPPVEVYKANIYKITWEDVNVITDYDKIEAELIYTESTYNTVGSIFGFTISPRRDCFQHFEKLESNNSSSSSVRFILD